MSNTSFHVEGLDEVITNIDKLALIGGTEFLKRELFPALENAAAPIKAAMEARAPRNRGLLADTVFSVPYIVTDRDKRSKYYGGESVAVSIGVARKGKQEKGQDNSRKVPGEQIYAIEFGSVEQPAQPFIRPALEGQAPTSVAILKAELELIIERYAEGLYK